MSVRAILRLILAAAFLAAGILDLAAPAPFLGITPDRVPFAPTVILMTGLADIAGAVARLAHRRVRG